tara:strand:- start:8343 stop:9128 length:786 start_codon:yes stop_codon:yes gene_type:complete
MRVAVIITGQLRDYKINCINHLKHIIEPNNADVFVYACSKNTLHTTGANVTQNYKITTSDSADKIRIDVTEIYGNYLKGLKIDENEELDDSNFGTLGYFKKRMNNQMQNIRNGFLMAKEYSEHNNFKYDVIVRCRPDNSMFLKLINLSVFDIQPNEIYTTIYPSGHKDPWFFSFSEPDTFDKYCSFVYQKDADESRTDNNFECPEVALENNLYDIGMKIYFAPSICLPFYQYDKTQPVTDFPFRQTDEKLIDANGNLVEQK